MVEGFNSGFKKLLGAAKPNLGKLINNMKEYDSIAMKRFEEFEGGVKPTGRTDYERKTKEYLEILKDFDKCGRKNPKNIMATLKKIAKKVTLDTGK